MAIGLFGHWGSGKSFLMRAVERRVDEITRAARESRRAQSDIGIYKNVVQIEFNAWHYVEGNLWASLVDQIFSNLRTSLDEGGDELDRRRRTVTEQLASTRTRHHELSDRIAELTRERQVKERRVAQLEQEQRKKLEQVEQLRLRDVAAAATLRPEDMAVVRDALERVGVAEIEPSAVEAAQSLQEAREVIRRSSALLAPLRKHRLLWVMLLIGVASVAPLVSYVLEHTDISSATRVLASVGALLGAAAGVLSAGTRWASNSLSRIEAAQARVRRRVEVAASAQATQTASLRQKVEQLGRDLTSASGERDAAASEIRLLKQRLRELTPGRLLAEFLEERSTSTDYRKHLGLTALVRRDFEELSRLVAENNRAIESGDEANADNAVTDFNRVVLYVDDLDRCPPRRVIEVLQAVHLLLSFPVFVVVVAVDPRWLSQSLHSEYEHLLDASSEPHSSRHATPQDYLEKIFQIPFSVAPLGIDQRRRLVRGLLGPEPPSPEAAAPQVEASANVGKLSTEYAGTEGSSDTEPTAAALIMPDGYGEPGDEVTVRDHESGTPAEHEKPPQVVAADVAVPAAEAGARDTPEPVDLTPMSLQFTAAERRFLGRLLPLLDTSPRGIKRYINIYHLIKSVVEIDGTDHTARGSSPYECAMLLLALQTGLPLVGPDLVRQLADDAHGSGPGKGPVTLGALLRDNPTNERSVAAREEFSRLQVWVAEEQADWPLADLASHARHVRLYTYG